MFKLETNLAGVLRQTELLMMAIPVAMQEALAPALWQEPARQLAERVLYALAKPDDMVHVAGFARSVVASVWQSGLELTMTSPFPGMRDILGEARTARALLDPADLGMGLFNLPVNEFEQLILDWVQTPEADGGKRRDARDQGKTDEEIAQLITYIMLAPQIGDDAFMARMRLTPHIEAYLAKRQGGRMDPKTVDMWLRAVLVAWREMFRTQYPVKVRELLRKKKGGLFA